MWYIFEALAAVAVAAFLVTQVWIPIIMGTKMFPLFRRHKLDAELMEAREELARQAYERAIAELRQQASPDEGKDSAKAGETTTKDE